MKETKLANRALFVASARKQAVPEHDDAAA